MVTPDLASAAAGHDRLLCQPGGGWPLPHQDRDCDAPERHLGLPVLHG